MADQIAESILSSVVQGIIDNLGSATTQEAGQWWGAEDDLERLRDTVSSIQATILDLEKQQTQSHQVKDWLSKLRDVMSQANSLLEDFQARASRRQQMGGSGPVRSLKVFFSSDNQIVYGMRLKSRIGDIRQRIDQIAADRINFQILI